MKYISFLCVTISLSNIINSVTAAKYNYIAVSEGKTRAAAQSDCEARGGDLASITDSTIQKTVYNLIRNTTEYYYIGAKRRGNNGWVWSHGTPVTYNSWYRQPTSDGGDCAAIFGSSGNWYQRSCDYTYRYICQIELIKIWPVNAKIEFQAASQVEIKINVITRAGPLTIYMYRYGRRILSNQNVRSGTSTFSISHASRSSAGEYKFYAYPAGGEFNRTATVTLVYKVLGKPTILRVNPSCSQTNISVTVEWKPDPDSLSIAHKINIIKHDYSPMASIAVKPTKQQEVTTIGDLQKDTRYRIRIEVCPKSCINDLRVYSSYFKTAGGLQSSVSNAQTRLVDSAGKKQCVVTWTDDISSDEDLSYEINATSSLVYKSPLATSTEFMETRNSTETSFNFQTEPNREYQFSIRARTCAGLGPPTNVSGQCITDAEAPNFVPKPTTSCAASNCIGSTSNMEIKLPVETNGRISCIFILVYLDNGGNSTQRSALTMIELAAIANETKYQESNRYISLAISRKNITENNSVVILGDDRATSCDITDRLQARKKRAIGDTVYEGRNWPMKQGNNYSIIVITSTPSKGGEVFLRSSEPNVFRNIAILEHQLASSSWIVGVIVGLVILVLLIAALIFFLKRRIRQGGEEFCHEKDGNALEMGRNIIPGNQQNEVNHHVGPPIQEENLYHQPNDGDRILEEGGYVVPIHGNMRGGEELYLEIDGNAPEMGRNIIPDVIYQNVQPA